MHRKKGSPDFKTGINSLISPSTDTSSPEDDSVTQNSSSFFLAILGGERWFAREGVWQRVVCWCCTDTIFLNSTILVSQGYHATDGGNSDRSLPRGRSELMGASTAWSWCHCGTTCLLQPRFLWQQEQGDLWLDPATLYLNASLSPWVSLALVVYNPFGQGGSSGKADSSMSSSSLVVGYAQEESRTGKASSRS